MFSTKDTIPLANDIVAHIHTHTITQIPSDHEMKHGDMQPHTHDGKDGDETVWNGEADSSILWMAFGWGTLVA